MMQLLSHDLPVIATPPHLAANSPPRAGVTQQDQLRISRSNVR